MTIRQQRLDLIDSITKLLEGGWCQIYWAVDRDGKPVEWWDDKAASYSLEGAFAKAAEMWLMGEREPVYSVMEEFIGTDWVKWNDKLGRTKKQVLKLMARTRACFVGKR